MNNPEHMLAVQNELGESPVSAPDEEALFWVDWGHNQVHRSDPELREHQLCEVRSWNSRPASAAHPGAGCSWVSTGNLLQRLRG